MLEEYLKKKKKVHACLAYFFFSQIPNTFGLPRNAASFESTLAESL